MAPTRYCKAMSARFFSRCPAVALLALVIAVTMACGDDDGSARGDDAPAASVTPPTVDALVEAIVEDYRELLAEADAALAANATAGELGARASALREKYEPVFREHARARALLSESERAAVDAALEDERAALESEAASLVAAINRYKAAAPGLSAELRALLDMPSIALEEPSKEP